MNPFEERQRGLTGSVIVAQGQSGTGKTRILTEAWLKSAMMFGGCAFALAPVNDVNANVASYRLGYQRALDSARSKGGVYAPESRKKAERDAILRLDFLRSQVKVYSEAAEVFEAIKQYGEDASDEDIASGKPQFSLLIDEGAVARRESPILEALGPIARNLRGIVYITGHRSMAIPPQIRAVRRATIVWRSSDGTGDEELDKAIASIPGFQYSPVMGDVEPSERWYRGVKYGPTGPEYFQFNPHVEPLPDWLLLPALPTAVEPRTFTRG